MGVFLRSPRSSRLGFSPSADSISMVLLSLGSSEEPQNDPANPLPLPAYEDVPMWNILPSYQLYELTFSKTVDPCLDDFAHDPPVYEVLPLPEATEASPPETTPTDYFLVRPAGTPNSWENSILGNTHKLKRLDRNRAEHLKIDVKLTANPGKRGVKPALIDPNSYEFAQGDAIHGFVTVKNVSSKPLPYNMFSVVFEGRASVNGDEKEKRPAVFHKFLNMLDYKALWTPAYFEEHVAGNQDPEDPVDGSRLTLSNQRMFEPGVTYKKFFDFTVPDKLLECACEAHAIPCHCELLPLIGLDKELFLLLLRKMREKSGPLKPVWTIGDSAPLPRKLLPPQSLRVKDFCFPDTAVGYSVEARVVGMLLSYGEAKKNEFIILKEESCPVRVVPRGTGCILPDQERGAQQYYEQFVRDVRASIELGRLLDQRSQQLRRPSILKNRQLYIRDSLEDVTSRSNESEYEVFLPLKKKLLTQPGRVVGMVGLKTPRKEYVMRYVPPYTFRPRTKVENSCSRSFTVPLELVFSFTENGFSPKTHKPPEVRGVSAEIFVCTYRSRKYPIPVEVTNKMRFQNKPHLDNLDKYVVQPFGTYLGEIVDLADKHGVELLNLDNQAIADIKALAHLQTKYNLFKVESSTSDTLPWSQGDLALRYTKKLNVFINMEGTFSREINRLSDDITAEAVALVPTFQSCIVGRYYYLSILVRLQNNDSLSIKVPLRVQN